MSPPDLTTLPSAVLEETFVPAEVVAVREDDGTVRLLMYCGPTGDGGYAALKHAVIHGEHAEGLFRDADEDAPERAEPQAEPADPDELHDALADELLRFRSAWRTGP